MKITKYKRGFVMQGLGTVPESTLYSVDQVVDKDLYTKETVSVYKLPDMSSPVLFTAYAGDRLGTVYTYLVRSPQVWWYLNPGYVLHAPGRFDISALRNQGVRTTLEINEEKRLQEIADNTPWYEKLLNNAGGGIGSTLKVAKTIVLVGLAGYVGIKLYSVYKKNNSK